jgi:hypothetical protein
VWPITPLPNYQGASRLETNNKGLPENIATHHGFGSWHSLLDLKIRALLLRRAGATLRAVGPIFAQYLLASAFGAGFANGVLYA